MLLKKNCCLNLFMPFNKMKKTALLFLLLSISLLKLTGQEVLIKRLGNQLAKHRQQDSFMVNRMNQLAQLYDVLVRRRDSVAWEALDLSRKINYPNGEAIALVSLALVNNEKGESKKANRKKFNNKTSRTTL